MYLSAFFNTYGLTVILKSILSTAIAAVAYKQILNWITVSILAVALFWATGFAILKAWAIRSGYGSTSEGLTGLLCASDEEFDEVPFHITFWISQVQHPLPHE